MRLIRLWKHLHLLKRGGIGMLQGGAGAAALGSCAVECPACPRELPPMNDNENTAALSGIVATLLDGDEPPQEPPQQPEGNTNDEDDEMPALIPCDEDEE